MSNGLGDKKRCEVCGFRRRGSNHDAGKHHIDAEEKRKRGEVPARLASR